MERWEILLLIVGVVIAVRSLLRLMLARRDLLVGQVKGQLQRQQRRKPKQATQKDEAA